jgi:hypothetical protein
MACASLRTKPAGNQSRFEVGQQGIERRIQNRRIKDRFFAQSADLTKADLFTAAFGAGLSEIGLWLTWITSQSVQPVGTIFPLPYIAYYMLEYV